MKIISKYKDFYDSYGFILGKPDESITYVRTTEVIDDDNKLYKSIIKKISEYGHLYFHVYGFKEDYVAWLESVVCGIYPYIYICPFYVIMQQLNNGRTFIPIDLKPIPISEEFVHDKNKREHIYDKVQTKFDEVNYIYKKLGKTIIHGINQYLSLNHKVGKLKIRIYSDN